MLYILIFLIGLLLGSVLARLRYKKQICCEVDRIYYEYLTALRKVNDVRKTVNKK